MVPDFGKFGWSIRTLRVFVAVLLIAGQVASAGHVHAHGHHHEHGHAEHGHDCEHGHHHEHKQHHAKGHHFAQWYQHLAAVAEDALGHEKPEREPKHEEDHHNCDVCRLAGRDHDAISSIVPPIRTPVTIGYRLVSLATVAVTPQSRSLAYQGRAPPLA